MRKPLAFPHLLRISQHPLKEELALAWEQESWEAMADFCADWCEKAIASGIDQLVSMAQSLTDHAEGILS